LFWFATASALLFIPTWKWPYEAANYYWPYFLTMGPFVAVLGKFESGEEKNQEALGSSFLVGWGI
jgi:hypothetical protein